MAAFKRVRPGLYVRTDSPKHVRITPEFAEAVRREGKSALLDVIVEQALREDAPAPEDRRK